MSFLIKINYAIHYAQKMNIKKRNINNLLIIVRY